jgi:hypothetical protein
MAAELIFQAFSGYTSGLINYFGSAKLPAKIPYRDSRASTLRYRFGPLPGLNGWRIKAAFLSLLGQPTGIFSRFDE